MKHTDSLESTRETKLFTSLGSTIFQKETVTLLSASVLLVFTLLLVFSFAKSGLAAINPQINYQGKLTDTGAVAVADGNYNITVRLYTSAVSATTTNIWEEERIVANQVALTSGLFSMLLGEVTSLSGVNFNQTLYLGIEIGGTTTPATWDGEMTPRKTLGAVPAAFEASQLDGLDSTQFVRSDATSTIATTSTDTLLTLLQEGAGAVLQVGSTSQPAMLTVLNNGNVGIGTTTPDRNLVVQTENANQVGFGVYGYNYSRILLQNSLNNGMFLQMNKADDSGISHLFRTYGDSYINQGNFGIGTTSPYAKLSLWGDTANTGATIFEITNDASTTVFSVGDGGTTTIISLNTTGNSTLGTVISGIWAGTSITDAFIDDTITASNYLALADWFATTTDQLTEGTTNLYFTDARSDTRFEVNLAGTTTDALSEGTTNFYYTTNRFAADLAATTTTALSEGTNLYYTDTRVDTRINASSTIVTTPAGTADRIIFWDNSASAYTFLNANTGLSIVNADLNLNASTTDLNDVNITALAYGELLTWDGTDWVDTATSSLGLGLGTFVSLSDTQGSLNANRIIYTNSGATALADSVNFVFTGTNLSVGTSSAYAKLSLWGDTANTGATIFEITNDASTTVFSVGDGGTTTIISLNTTGNSTLGTIISGIWAGTSITDAYIDDNITASNYLALTDWFATTTDQLSEGTTNLYFTNARFDTRLTATTSLPNLAGVGTIATGTWNGSVIGEIYGGTGTTTYATGDILYANGTNSLIGLNAGNNGQVLKLQGGLPTWDTDLTGSGGSGLFSTTSNSLAVFPTDTSDVVIIGNSSTSSPSSIFEVSGSSYFSGNVGVGTTSPYAKLSVVGQIVGEYFTATSSNATSTFFGNISVGGNSTLGTVISGIWAGTSITDAYIDDNITASNYLALTDWFATTTDQLTEGTNNLYFTDARSDTRFEVNLAGTTTDALSEGTTNFYYTTNRFATDLSGTTTDALSEGTNNRYFTDARVTTVINASSTLVQTPSDPGADRIIFWDNSASAYTFLNANTGLSIVNADLNLNASTTDLNDVNITALAYGELLTWDGTDWVDTATSSLGLGLGTFVSLSDTQGSLNANRIIYTNSGATALADSVNFVFDGSNLGIGTSSPYAKLSVVGQIVGEYFTATSSNATSTFFGNISVGGNSTLGTVISGIWQGTSITDAFIDDTITASNYLALTDWFATTTDQLTEGTNNLYFTDARSDLRINATTTISTLTNLPNLAQVGTIATGTWQGDVLAALYGGTGTSTYSVGDILYASGVSTLNTLGVGSDGQVLKLQGGIPTWDADISGAGGSGVWATTSDASLAIAPVDSSDVVIIGGSVTSTLFAILEVKGSNGSIYVEDNVGIGTTSPWATLSVEIPALQAAFVVSNNGSTTPALYVGSGSENGRVAVGTSTAKALFTVDNTTGSAASIIAQFLNSSGLTFSFGDASGMLAEFI